MAKNLKDKTGFVVSEFDFTFENESSSVLNPHRNDIFYAEFFDLNLYNLRIEVDPGSTDFWRIGLTFLKFPELDDLNYGRLGNAENAYLQVEIGERNPSKEKEEWIMPNQIHLKEYWLFHH